jgi:mRNA interferase MazF
VRRGELYLVQHPSSRDPKRQRVFVVISRQVLLDSTFSSVICAPVYSRRDGIHTQVDIGIDEGLKHESSIHCDELMSLPKSSLNQFIGSLSPAKQAALDRALAFAVGLTSFTFHEGD